MNALNVAMLSSWQYTPCIFIKTLCKILHRPTFLLGRLNKTFIPTFIIFDCLPQIIRLTYVKLISLQLQQVLRQKLNIYFEPLLDEWQGLKYFSSVLCSHLQVHKMPSKHCLFNKQDQCHNIIIMPTRSLFLKWWNI